MTNKELLQAITQGDFHVSRSTDYFEDGAVVVRGTEPHDGIVIAVLTNTPHRDANAIAISKLPKLLREHVEMVEQLKTHCDLCKFTNDDKCPDEGDCNTKDLLSRIEQEES